MMGFMPTAEELSERLNSPVDDKHFCYLPTFQTVLFCGENLFFLRLKAFFLHSELSRGTTTATVIGEAVVDLKLEVK